MMLFVIVCLAAILLDRLAGEPRRWHPLVGLGWCIDRLEAHFNPDGKGDVAAGALAVVLLLIPFIGGSILLSFLPLIPWVIVSAVLLWLCIGYRSLAEHGMAVYRPLVAGDGAGARERVGMMVSRDTRELDEAGIATATTDPSWKTARMPFCQPVLVPGGRAAGTYPASGGEHPGRHGATARRGSIGSGAWQPGWMMFLTGFPPG